MAKSDLLLPLYDNDSQRDKAKNACKNACFFTFFAIIGFIAAFVTWVIVYEFTAKFPTPPDNLLDEKCYLVVSTMVYILASDPRIYAKADGFNTGAFIEKFADQRKIRSDYYSVDPIIILALIYALFVVLVMFRTACFCYFKKDKPSLPAFLIFYLFTFTFIVLAQTEEFMKFLSEDNLKACVQKLESF